MKDEVAQGIKNALERGQTLESAISSFINAGYSATDVHEAAESLNNSALSLLPLQQAPADSMDSQDEPNQTGMFKAEAMQNIPSPAPLPNKAVQEQAQPQSSFIKPLPVSKPSGAKKEGGVSKTKVIILSVVLVLLLIALGVSILFKTAIFGP